MTTTLAPRVVEPEIVEKTAVAGFVKVRVLDHPFSLRARDFTVAEGTTLAEIVERARLSPDWPHALVTVGGDRVAREWWPRVRPKAGQFVVVRALPAGGGDNTLKGVLQIVVGVILAVVAWWFPALWPLAIGMILGGIATLVMPPPQAPKLSDHSGQTQDAPVFSITGSRNQATPYAPIVFILGKHLLHPAYGSRPFTELRGNDQYLRMLFVIGTGKYEITEHRIGETPIAEFGTDIEIEVRVGDPTDPPLTLFTVDPFQLDLSINLMDGAQHIRTTEPDTDEISVEFLWPKGLVAFTPNGQKIQMPATLIVEFRPTSGGGWTQAEIKTYYDARTTAKREAVRWTVPRDQYDVRVYQTDGYLERDSDTKAPFINAATWVVLRSFTYTDPIAPSLLAKGVARVAIVAKATDRLNGIIDTYNCKAQSVVPDYDFNTLTWIERPTRNPASLYRHVMQGIQFARPVADARIDLNALEAWHDDCRLTGRTFDYVVEQTMTAKQLLDHISAIGRATVGTVDGTHGVVRDIPQAGPAGLYNQRNTRNYRGLKMFRDLPHALKCTYISDETWQIEEYYVYWDGYSATGGGGTVAATKFESIQFIGATNTTLVFKLARYHLANAYLRPEIHEFETDPEHLANTRGDRIAFSHDVPLFGIKAARVRSIVTNGSGDVTAVTLDDPVPMEAGPNYGLRWRRGDGVISSHQVVTVAGNQASLTFTSPHAAATGPQAGSLASFGVLGSETIDGLILRIEMMKDLGARIVMVDYAPAVHDADTGPVPPYDPHVTLPPELRPPPAPIPDGLMSEGLSNIRTARGTVGARSILHYRMPSTTTPIVGSRVEGGFRLEGASVPWTAVPFVATETNEITYAPLEPGTRYDFRLRCVSATNRSSAWVFITGVEIPNPPLITYYELIATPFGYAATISGQVPRFGPPNVTGLRLSNPVTDNPNDTVFAGRDAKFAWNAVTMNPTSGPGEDDQTQDNQIRGYAVEIHTNGLKVRWGVMVATPGYEYRWEQNLEDHKPAAPSREITIKVWAVTHDGAVSREPAVLTVENVAPDMSQVSPLITPLIDAALADWSSFTSTDHDFEKFEVRLSLSSPPLEVFDERSPVQKKIIIPNLVNGQTYFLQIMPFDAFGEGIPSQIVEIVPKSAAESYRFFARELAITGLVFTPDALTNIVSWTAGTVTDLDDEGNIRETAVSAGSAQWLTGTTLFLSWEHGANELDAIPDSSAAIVVGRSTFAVYNGGRNLVVTYGKATVHGQDILAGTIGAAQLVANQVLITGSAQIQAAIIKYFHLEDGTITNVKIQNAAITTAKILDAAITRAKIALAAIGTAEIDDLAVTTAKIALASITSAHIQNLSVDTAHIKDLSVNGIKVTPGAIDSLRRQGVNVGVISVNSQNLVTFYHNLGIVPLVTWQWIHQNGTFATWLYECDSEKFTVAISHPSAPIFAIGTLIFKYW